MRPGVSSTGQKPRELRRRCIVPARLRHGASWSDTCILNISSRGLLIHTGRPIQQGSEVELRRGECIVIARVMWREGGRAGLRAEDRVPVDQIVTLCQSPAFQLAAVSGERRNRSRADEGLRLRGRVIEFGGVLVIGACLAAAGLTMVEAAFARPMAIIAAAFDP
jgi:hypothetical protein